MRITNANGLPQAVYELIANDEYSKGDADISVTELIDSPRIRVLKQKHDHEIEVEADTRMALTLGKALHSLIEKGTKTGIAERRLSTTVLGWKISGGMDHYNDGVLTDYKTATCWKTALSEEGTLPEYEKQLNVYAYILRANKIPVKELKVFILFKDWNRSMLKKPRFILDEQAGYPEKEWLYLTLNLWSDDACKKYVYSQVKAHQDAPNVLPKCSSIDNWKTRRCKTYCNVNSWCDVYQSAIKTGLMEGN